jgi:hypothetical protein
MRDRFPLAMLTGVLFLGVLGVWISRGAARGSFADVLSTFRAEPDGARGLYLFAEASTLPVERVKQSFEVIDPGAQLVLLAVDLAEDEGRRLHLFDDDDDKKLDQPLEKKDDDQRKRGSNSFRAPEVSASEREKLLGAVRDGATLIYVPWGAHDNPLLRALDVKLHPAEKGLGLRTLVPAQPTPWTRGVERVEANVQAYLELPPLHTAILVDSRLEEPVAAAVTYGQGQVIIIGAPELAMNKALARADNARFWRSLLSTVGQKGKLVFDEYHHGFTGERSLGEFAARYGLQFALLQLLLGVGFWALALRRFGRPRNPAQDVRIGATDALSATSRLYREGKHHAHAGQAIVKGVAQELGALAGTGARAEPREVAQALKARGRTELGAGLDALISHGGHCASDADVNELAQRAAGLRRQVRTRKSGPAPLKTSPKEQR